MTYKVEGGDIKYLNILLFINGQSENRVFYNIQIQRLFSVSGYAPRGRPVHPVLLDLCVGNPAQLVPVAQFVELLQGEPGGADCPVQHPAHEGSRDP